MPRNEEDYSKTDTYKRPTESANFFDKCCYETQLWYQREHIIFGSFKFSMNVWKRLEDIRKKKLTTDLIAQRPLEKGKAGPQSLQYPNPHS